MQFDTYVNPNNNDSIQIHDNKEIAIFFNRMAEGLKKIICHAVPNSMKNQRKAFF
jgi:hypothetical protein